MTTYKMITAEQEALRRHAAMDMLGKNVDRGEIFLDSVDPPARVRDWGWALPLSIAFLMSVVWFILMVLIILPAIN